MMRDPSRINRMVNALRSAWKAAPDLRLGQLVVNMANQAKPGVDPFYVEDGPMEQALRANWIHPVCQACGSPNWVQDDEDSGGYTVIRIICQDCGAVVEESRSWAWSSDDGRNDDT